MNLFIDTTSYPGAWRDAIGRGCLAEAGPVCRACGKPICDHPDPVFCGVLPDQPTGDRESDVLRRSAVRSLVHVHSDTETGARNHVA